MIRTLLVALALSVLANPLSADDAAPSRGIILTITWQGDAVSIDKAEPKEVAVPLQRGMPQLWSRFLELRDKQDEDADVYYAAPLFNARTLKASPSDKEGVPTYRVIVPDLPNARYLVIIERDPKKGRVEKAHKTL